MATQTASQNNAQSTAENTVTDKVADGIESITKTFDENLGRVQDLGESFAEAAKLSGTVTLDAYEKAVASALDFQKSVAAATRIDAISAIVEAQSSLIQGVTTATTTAVREALK